MVIKKIHGNYIKMT